MKKIQVFLGDRQAETLKEKSEQMGISLSEMLRRIVDNTINQDFNIAIPIQLVEYPSPGIRKYQCGTKVTTDFTNE